MRKYLAAIAIVTLGLLAFQPAHATPGCNLEISGGVGVGTTNVFNTDLAQKGGVIGLGADCYLQSGPWQFGGLVRYSLMNVDGKVIGEDISADRLWEAAAKVGARVTKEATIYGLAGWSGTEVSLSSWDKSPNGLMLGAGLDLALSKHTALRFEYSWHDFEKEKIIGPLTAAQDLHIFRVGFVIALGGVEAPFANMTIPDDPPPASGDPKLNPRRR